LWVLADSPACGVMLDFAGRGLIALNAVVCRTRFGEVIAQYATHSDYRGRIEDECHGLYQRIKRCRCYEQ
jgi:hypothetical protein